ncbi:MAG TPA: aminotransferase class V-fold PLP-dependent enzyme [Actinomycetota bacterium]|nr:aminotransferase class V-fold PLP-dependent enzyme [Actinomycetota bacterium]
MTEASRLVRTAMRHCERWLDALGERPVAPPVDDDELARAFDDDLPAEPADVHAVVDDLAARADAGLVASPGPRYFGFVTGGAHPAALAADWLTSAWDQVATSYAGAPAAAVIEDVTARWLLELLDLPRTSSVGFTTGATTANLTALAAARRAVLLRVGWDLDDQGLAGAPPVHVVAGEQRHSTIDGVLRLLGIGAADVTVVPVDDQGRVLADAFAAALDARPGPALAIAQCGNVATGAFDPIEDVARAAAKRGAWLHVDGAFGLWARAARGLRHATRGVEAADSWAVDAHKWLNVPYDCGFVVVRDADAHEAVVRKGGSYAMTAPRGRRDGSHWVPEFSRRARAIPVYAVLRALGRSGVDELVTRCCRLARRFARAVAHDPGVEVLNDVVLNQVLLAFPCDGDERRHAARVIRAVHADGTFWAGSTEWNGRLCMRVSVSNWSTTEADVDRSAERLLAIVAEAREHDVS